MATPDPSPSGARARPRPLRILRAAALCSLALAAFAIALLAKGGSSDHIRMLIAIALTAGLGVLLGTALMSLRFLGNGRRRNADAADIQDKDGHDPGS